MRILPFAFLALSVAAVAAPPAPLPKPISVVTAKSTPLPRVVLRIPVGRSAAVVGANLGLRVRTLYPGGIAVFDAPSVAEADRLALRARQIGLDPHAFRDEILPIERHSFLPNDPYYVFGNSGGQAGQWHLVNTGNVSGRSVDARLLGAWLADRTGLGAIVGIVDDSFEPGHADLVGNRRADLSYDFGQNDADPSPVATTDRHGISVAGVAAARGGNGIGMTGAAPFASLAGLRCDFNGSGPASQFVSATSHRDDVIKVKNHSYGITTPFANNGAQINALRTGAAAGVIHVVSAGNSRGTINEDCNKSMMQNDPSTIAVAAIGSDEQYSWYSSFGANVFVCAPSNSDSGFGIHTTDRTGTLGYNGHPDNAYTNSFGGTSSAAPLVSGVMALLKEVRPDADVRLAKHLLARTSVKWDPTDPDWVTNSAGLSHNISYGFGGIDATALTDRAALNETVSPLTIETIPTTSVGIPIPDNSAAGVVRTFNVSTTTPIEDLRIGIVASHPYRGDLELLVTSPLGTVSRVMSTAGDGADNISWTFTSVAFWGENPQGTWTVRLADRGAADLGTWTSYSAQVRTGQLVQPVTDAGTVASPPNVSQTKLRFGTTTAEAFRLTVTNTGTTTWRSTDGYGIRIVSGEAADLIVDPFPVVAPGATAEIPVRIADRETGGRRDYRFSLARNGVEFGSQSLASVELLYDWDAELSFDPGIPTLVSSDSTIPVGMRLRNVGMTTWRADRWGRVPQISVRLLNGDGWSGDAFRLAPGATVPSGGSVLLTSKLRTPPTPGTSRPSFRAYRGRASFGPPLLAPPITVE